MASTTKTGRVDITGQTSYQANPDIDLSGLSLGQRVTSMLFRDEHVDHEVRVSFDGVTDTLILTPSAPTETQTITWPAPNRPRAWLKVDPGAVGSVKVMYAAT